MELIPKIIAFDNNFSERTLEDEKVKVGIIYSHHVKNSTRVKDEIFEIISKKDQYIIKSKVEYVFIDVENYKSILKKDKFYAVYLTPLRGIDLLEVFKLCQNLNILSITGVYDYYDLGASVYFDLVNNSPKININLLSSKSEGVNFSSHLLKLAEIKK